jgi:Holliday junction resolvase RusA-like endonuclease
MIIKFALHEKPVSVNRQYRKGKQGNIYSTAGKFKASVAWVAKEAIGKIKGEYVFPLCRPVSVHIDYYFPDRRRRDCTNFDKAILDALNGIIYEDDSQVGSNFNFFGYRASFAKYLCPDNPRIEILIDTEPERMV